jgi:hypothetical protein
MTSGYICEDLSNFCYGTVLVKCDLRVSTRSKADNIEKQFKAPIQRISIHRMFLRGILGVNKTTSTFVVLGEFGRYPLEYFWWQQTLKYYDRLRKSTADRLLYCAYQTQIQMLSMLNDNQQCWLRNMQLWLKDQGVEVLYANIKCAIASAQASYLESTYGEQARAKSSRLHTYQLMNTSCITESGYSYAHQRYLQVITNVQLRQSLSRFKCSNHRLEVECGRQQSLRVSRGEIGFVVYVP